MTRKLGVSLAFLLLAQMSIAQAALSNTDQESRIDSTLSKMTVDEKVQIIAGVNDFYTRPIARLGIAWGNINGQFSFGDGPTSNGTCPTGTTCQLGDPLASALLGDFQGFDQSTARPTGYFRYNQLEFYVQDTWKASPRLTLDYGMRFAWIPPQYDAKNQVALFNPAAYDPTQAVTIDYTTGNIINADGGNPLNGMQYTKSNQIPAGGWNSRGISAGTAVWFCL